MSSCDCLPILHLVVAHTPTHCEAVFDGYEQLPGRFVARSGTVQQPDWDIDAEISKF
jgi:hypothetical protein